MSNNTKLQKLLTDLINKQSVAIAIVLSENGQLDNPRSYTDPFVAQHPQFRALIEPIYDSRVPADINGLGEYIFTYDGDKVSVSLSVPELGKQGYHTFLMSLSDAIIFISDTDNFSIALKIDE